MVTVSWLRITLTGFLFLIAGSVWAGGLPVVSITSADAQSDEAGPNVATFTVSRTNAGNIAAGLSVNVAFGGTASRNVDYTLSPNFSAVFIPANQLSVTTTVTPRADNLIEGQETIEIELLQSVGVYQIDSTMNQVELSIDDDVAEVTIEASNPVANEVSQAPGTFTIRRSDNGNVTQALFVNVIVSGSASRNVDYIFNPNFSTSVTIPANELAADVAVVPLADVPGDEGEETVILEIVSGTGYLQGSATNATVVITDLVIFADGFEAQQTTQACVRSLVKSDPARFFDQGAVLLDLSTGLLWNSCGLNASFDWVSEQCLPDKAALTIPAGALEALRAGLRGDNGGYDDWRLASKQELSTLPVQCAGALVRGSF